MAPNVYLARHGQTIFNVENWLQGCSCDGALTPLGRAQAERVGRIVGRLPGAATISMVSSPLGRARTTTEIILSTLGRPEHDYAIDDRIREIDFGDWTGLTMDEVRQRHGATWATRRADPWSVRPPGGECYADVAARALDWFDAQTTDVVAVAHGVIGRILRGSVLGLDGVGMRKLDEPHDCLFHIRDGQVERLREDGGVK